MIEDPAATGVTALLFAVVLGLFEFLKRIWPASKNGQGKIIVECPNKIHSLNGNIERLAKGYESLEEQHRPYDGRAIVAALTRLEGIEESMVRLEKRTGPIDGVEQWKRSQMQDVLLQEIIDRASESVDLASESVTLQQKTLLVLEEIAQRPPRREDKPDAKRKLRFPDEPSPG